MRERVGCDMRAVTAGIGLASLRGVRRLLLCGAAVVGLLGPVGVRAADPELLVRVGDDSPLGRPFSSVSDPTIDDQGRIGFIGTSAGLFRRNGESIDGLLVAGDPIAGGRTIAGLGVPEAGEPGCVAATATFVGGGRGIVRLCGGVANLVVSSGDTVPSGPTIVSFGTTVAYGVAGDIVFVANLNDGTSALVRYEVGGAFTEIAHTGTAAPTGGTFAVLRAVGIASTRDVGFRATVNQGPNGLFSWASDTQQVTGVVVENSPSPGSGIFTAIGNATMNANAQFAFRAVSSGSGSGVYRADAGTAGAQIIALAKEGDPIPTAIGGTFKSFATSIVPSINVTGQVTFRATIADSVFNAAVFLAAPDGTLQDQVVAGQSVGSETLVRLRDPLVADDGSVLVPASLPGGGSGLYVVRQRTPVLWLQSTALTSVGGGYRFIAGSARDRAEDVVVLGQREGVFLASPGAVAKVAILGEATPLEGTYATFDALGAGGSQTGFHALINAGRAGEAIFAADGSRVRTVARSEARIPKVGRLVNFFAGTAETVVSLALGPRAVGFQAILQFSNADSGLFSAVGSKPHALALQGQRTDKGRLGSFGSFDLLSGNRVAFIASRSGGSTPSVFLKGGGRLRTLAANDKETKTRAAGKFGLFEGLDAGAAGVAFHATLRSPSGEGIFIANQSAVGAVVLSQDAAPGGGRFVDLGTPAVAGNSVVFVGALIDGSTTGGLYRTVVLSIPRPTQTPPVTALLTYGQSLANGTLVAIGTPRANRFGTLAFSAEIAGGDTAQGLFRLAPGAS